METLVHLPTRSRAPRTVARTGARTTALLAALALSAACTASPATTAAGSSTSEAPLRLAYLADMSVPDPDVFYDIEGNAVILSVYEGLVEYAPDSTTVVPSLAERWTVSADGLTYTFTLREGVVFHDGTPFDSAAVKTSLDRRNAVGNAPAYMLEPVAAIETPDPRTVVLRLESVTSPFLDYLASSWGPKMISPKALADNRGSDDAQTWAKSNAVGTGPYRLTAFERGSTYTLTRFDEYWGEKAKSPQVDIRITPDMNAQILALRSGDQDAVLHSYPVAELEQAASDPALQVESFDSFLQSLLYLNTEKAPFSDPAVRDALAGAIDRDAIVEEVYGDYGSPAKAAYPEGILDPALSPVSYPASTAKVPGSPAVDFAYSADESGVQKRLAQLLQQNMTAAGFRVTIREVQPAQAYGFAADVQNAPDMMLQTNTPDAAHPDTWSRILWGTGGGLNFFAYSNPAVDALLDRGRSTTDDAAADALYGEAGQLLAADKAILFLADVKDTMVVRKELTDLAHVPNYPWTLDLATIGRS